jgi:hypothetical protein
MNEPRDREQNLGRKAVDAVHQEAAGNRRQHGKAGHLEDEGNGRFPQLRRGLQHADTHADEQHQKHDRSAKLREGEPGADAEAGRAHVLSSDG